MKGIDTQLKKIDKIVKGIEEQEEKTQFEKYKYIFDDAIKYIKTKRVLLYGGMAINDILPAKDKIYSDKILPDIDIFSEHGKKESDDIVKHFIKNGYNKVTTNYTEALHEGTYKIYIDSIQVFDITTVSKNTFKRLSHNSIRGDSGIKVVNPQFLRLSLHMMMSQSHDSHRWEKVYKRLITFYKHFPPKECLSKKLIPKSISNDEFTKLHYIPQELITNVYKYIEDKDYILFGIHEILAYLQNYPHKSFIPANSKIAPIQIIVDTDIVPIAHDIIKYLNIDALSLSKLYVADEFIPEHVIIKFKNHPFIEIYNAPICMTYIQFKDRKIASIHTMIRMYLSMILSTYDHFESENHSLECLVNLLSTIQQKMAGSRKKIFQQIVSECYGPYMGLVTLRRQRLIRQKK